MPDLSLTGEQQLLRTSARGFVERECSLPMVRETLERDAGFSAELWREVAELGWAGILIPVEYGGEGGKLTDAAVLCEEIGRGLLPVPHHSSAVLGALILSDAGSDEQRQRLLPAIAQGDEVLALAFTEADYGWTPERVRMTASASGDGFVLRGDKSLVPDAGATTRFVCAARTGGEGAGGVTLFLVPADAPGVQRRRVAAFSGDPLFDVTFDGVTVSADDVVGEVGRGWDSLAPVLDIATALACAYVAGAAQRVYEMTMDFAQHRVQFGQPISRFQRVQDRLIDMVNAADAARWTAYEAIWKLENGKPGADAAVSVAKAAASDGFYQLCESAHHVHAGVGSDKAYGLYLYTQKSRSFYHYLGDPDFHRRRLARLLDL